MAPGKKYAILCPNLRNYYQVRFSPRILKDKTKRLNWMG